MALIINGIRIKAEEFAHEDCHKFYLINSPEDHERLAGYGYTFYGIDSLPKYWKKSCPFRFISDADLRYSIVPQCADEPKFKVVK